MSNEEVLINRVAQSPLITIKPEDFLPIQKIVEFDLKNYLFRELILKELDFRSAMKEINWLDYKDCILAVYCSADVIIPTWAYMLVSSHAKTYVSDIFFGNKETVLIQYVNLKIANTDFSLYKDKKIVLKGCSDNYVPPSAYLDITNRLLPIASSIMYGEPCSTVPIYKRK